MPEEIEAQIRRICDKVNALPPGKQEAVVWAAQHMERDISSKRDAENQWSILPA